MQKDVPTKKELEKSLARLRKISASINRFSGSRSEEASTKKFRRQVAMGLAEQAMIVDKFISLSRDQEILERFTGIVKLIEEKNRLMEEAGDSDERALLRREILEHVEEWIGCLELIITGVINQASQQGRECLDAEKN